MDVQKQSRYWKKSAEEDLEAGRSLLKNGHYRHSLFFAHLALEKMLKANVVKQTKEIPPRTHNLERLAELAGIKFSSEQEKFISQFRVYQLLGRYPDMAQASIDSETAHKRFSQAKEMIEWLKNQL